MNQDSQLIAQLKTENEQLRQKLKALENLQIKSAQIEQALRESETTFRNLAETIPAPIHILQGNHFVYINSQFTAVTGYSLEECAHINFWDMIHPDYQDVIRDRAWARQRGEEVIPVTELIIISKYGQEIWVDHCANNTIWEGNPAVIAVLHDLTERKHIEETIVQQHEILQETYSELEEFHAEMQSSQNSLLEVNARLRESEERLDLALWASDEGLWDWNLETGYLYSSDRGLSLLGYSCAEFEPHMNSWVHHIHPVDLPRVDMHMKSHLKGETDYFEVEYRLINRAGESKWILDRGKVVRRNKEGRAIRMVGTKHNITQQKAVQDALQLSETRYRTLMETIPEIVAHSDLNGNYVWVNTPGKEFFGEDVCQHHFRDYFITKNDYHDTLRIIAPLLKKDDVIQLETWLKREDGRSRLLKWQSKTLKENGQIVGLVSTARDITEKREAELRLEASEARYRHLFEKSPVGLLKVSLNGDILDANDYYVETVGAPSKAAVTNINLFAETQKRGDLAAIIRHISEHYATSTTYSTEMQFVSKWGKALYMHFKIDPVLDYDGHFTQLLVACEEISERKLAEARIKYLSYNDSLTGLYNRAFFDEELHRLDVDRQFPLSIIIGDVNGLKLANDTFGHLSGDKLLVTIADILKKSCRSEDIIARWGGDEFAILLPQTSEKMANIICDRIRAGCAASDPEPIQASIALGVASKSQDNDDVYKVIAEAEDIMYRNKLLESKSIRNSIITSLEASLHEKTFETREHAHRMQKLCIEFGRALDLPASELDRLALLANLHDIGKIGVPDRILTKPGPLSGQEWDEIKKHPEIGYRIVCSSHELVAIAEEILAHHEKWDGSGYPGGLRAENIPLLARILTIVDAYDVMTHIRSYKQAIRHTEALEEIARCSNSQFDPKLVPVFLGIFMQKTDTADTISL